MRECPCKGCTKRKATSEYNCHSDCKDYSEYKADLAQMRDYNCGKEDVYVNYYVKTMRKRKKIKNEKNRI